MEKDIEKAVQYYQLAAEQGEPYALNNLGCCYSGGEGVEQDYEKAMQYFQAAAEQGNADAIYMTRHWNTSGPLPSWAIRMPCS